MLPAGTLNRLRALRTSCPPEELAAIDQLQAELREQLAKEGIDPADDAVLAAIPILQIVLRRTTIGLGVTQGVQLDEVSTMLLVQFWYVLSALVGVYDNAR